MQSQVFLRSWRRSVSAAPSDCPNWASLSFPGFAGLCPTWGWSARLLGQPHHLANSSLANSSWANSSWALRLDAFRAICLQMLPGRACSWMSLVWVMQCTFHINCMATHFQETLAYYWFYCTSLSWQPSGGTVWAAVKCRMLVCMEPVCWYTVDPVHQPIKHCDECDGLCKSPWQQTNQPVKQTKSHIMEVCVYCVIKQRQLSLPLHTNHFKITLADIIYGQNWSSFMFKTGFLPVHVLSWKSWR